MSDARQKNPSEPRHAKKSFLAGSNCRLCGTRQVTNTRHPRFFARVSALAEGAKFGPPWQNTRRPTWARRRPPIYWRFLGTRTTRPIPADDPLQPVDYSSQSDEPHPLGKPVRSTRSVHAKPACAKKLPKSPRPPKPPTSAHQPFPPPSTTALVPISLVPCHTYVEARSDLPDGVESPGRLRNGSVLPEKRSFCQLFRGSVSRELRHGAGTG